MPLGLALLPAYWYFWRQPLDENDALTRKALTALLAFIVWWAFLAGHIANNIREIIGARRSIARILLGKRDVVNAAL